jgi:hypothetical protein
MTRTLSPATDPRRELSLHEMDAVVGGAKGDSGGLQAAKGIDLTAFLAQMDKAIAKLKQI